MSDVSPLQVEIRRRIAAAGPMPVGEFMALCLVDPAHGYYTTRDPFGTRGDFITAPEISQMFGEMIGLWMAAVWRQMGAPENVRIVELGPGRGTMMKDALRAAKVMPGFHEAVVVHLVEISPALEAAQQRTLEPLGVPLYWHRTLADVPRGTAIVVANEFFDALPVSQAVKTADGWYERLVDVDSSGHLAFTIAPEPLPHFGLQLAPAVRNAPDGSIFEWRTDTVAMELGARLARDGAAALVIDYGHAESAAGETLQAIGKHVYANPLAAPGDVDLTAHVDFQALGGAVEAMGAIAFDLLTQSQFLRRLGIVSRAAKLKANAADAAAIDIALKRLISEGEAGMGTQFKAAAFAHPKLGVLPGFES
ncbi:MAG TPA: SAM-dependent methyltransferase [Pseudolabrys sp.]|nr:SAM-dependent methyltransferase [Pseudolabrys sp.]